MSSFSKWVFSIKGRPKRPVSSLGQKSKIKDQKLRQLRRRGHLLRFLSCLVDGADHVKCLLGHVVAVAVKDLFKSFNSVVDLHVLAFETGELLADRKRLRKETLDLAGTRDGELVVLAELVET